MEGITIEEVIMSDIVLKAQQWLNSTYKNKTGYIPVGENGRPGTVLSSAPESALQIELGLIAGQSTDAMHLACCRALANYLLVELE